MNRPDGSQATTFGWVLIVVGVLAVLVVSGAETVEGMIWGALVANLGIGLGILLVSLGYLVRAIWFLPGREIEEQAIAPADTDESGVFCDWCHLWVEAPGRPCSQSDDDAIRTDAAAVAGKTGIAKACRAELISRGYIEN